MKNFSFWKLYKFLIYFEQHSSFLTDLARTVTNCISYAQPVMVLAGNVLRAVPFGDYRKFINTVGLSLDLSV